MEKKIALGKCQGQSTYADLGKCTNGHVAIFGTSGAGKSVLGQKLVSELVSGGNTVLVLDIHQTFSKSQIFEEFRESIGKFSNEIDAYVDGIMLPLFEPVIDSDGAQEDQIDVLISVMTVLTYAMKLGCRQSQDLYRALKGMADSGSYSRYGIASLEDFLSLVDSEVAANVHDKLRYVMAKNVFRDGSKWYEEQMINIFRLSKFDVGSQALIAEILLSYIWRQANAGKFSEKGIYILCDECQALHLDKRGIVNTILCEGRKMGVNLIMITQSLSGGCAGSSAKVLMQAGLKMYFEPKADEMVTIAKAIGSARYKDYLIELKSLRVGQCIAVGSLLLNNLAVSRPLRISV